MTQITPHFTLDEFTSHDGVGYPLPWVEERLQPLCVLLELLRAACGNRPLVITSGFRSPAHNAVVGGATHSQHMEGRAADIVVAGMSPARVHAMALSLHRAGTIRLGGLGSYARWTHVDIRPGLHLARWNG